MIYGLILVGGRSSRMGSDKSQINYHGIPQAQFLYDLLSKYCSKVFFSCREEQATNFQPSIIDKYSEAGPISGLLSAFDVHPNASWLLIACDMPLINNDSIQFLLKNRNLEKSATAFLNIGNNSPEPLFTIYENSGREKLFRFFEEGSQSLKHFLQSIDIQLIKEEKEILLNINTPTDFENYVSNSANK